MSAPDPQIALIGSGSISHYHVSALEAVGLEINAVASMNPDSDTIADFADEFDISETYRGEAWRDMVEDSEWDGIVIATHISGTPAALRYSLKKGVPVLVEKPVAWSSKKLQKLRKEAHKQVIVGYNRRYYNPVQQARDFLSNHRPVMATAEFPAASDLESFIGMSSHGIDLLRYLFGDLDLLNTQPLVNDNGLQGYATVLESDSGDLINMIGNWEAPSNIGINIDYHDVRFQIKPYEQGRKFKGFEIKEPDENGKIPVRQYLPQQIEEINLNSSAQEYKPGFYEQAKVYKNMIAESEIDPRAATLNDAEQALKLCEKILPDHLPYAEEKTENNIT